MANYVKTGVVLDPVQVERIDKIAQMVGLSRSMIIRIMISDALRTIDEQVKKEAEDGRQAPTV